MFLNSATLQDLAIVPTPMTRDTTLWSLVDRTRTRVGREALRERLLAPPHAADEILALQRAHQVLAAEGSAYRTTLDRADSDGVEGYLRLNLQLPSDMPAAIRFRKWSRQYLQDVEHGQASVTAFLEGAAHLRGRLAVTDATVLADLGEQIAALLETPDAGELRRLASRQSLAAKRAFDSLRVRPPKQSSTASCFPSAGSRLYGVWAWPHLSTGGPILNLPRSCVPLASFILFLGPRAVPNNLHLDEQVRVCFVTGPNMAGKSTFLKAVAIAVLLAHAGCGVPAVSMEFRTVGTVFSSVHVVDNLSAGESFYLAEVRRIAALAVALSDHGSAVAVVDEPFRGTNVHDAAEAILAVITRLAAHPAALVLVASHLGEVVPAILDDPRIALFQFAADVTAEQPRFDYRLRAGVSAQRLGMTLLRQERVLDLLERSAKTADVQSNHALEPTAQT